MRNFKELMVWQNGMNIWLRCYELTKSLPKEEKFGLTSQINRAALSIPANIAEGSSRNSQKDYARFIRIALGSSFELETIFLGIDQLDLVDDGDVVNILELIQDEQKMLSGFLRKLASS